MEREREIGRRQAQRIAKRYGVRVPRVGYEACLSATDNARCYLASTGHPDFGWFGSAARKPFRVWCWERP
jgi:hypothetical protein